MSDIKQRGRPAGKKNLKQGVRLKTLCELFSPDFIVPVSKNLAAVIKQSNASVILEPLESIENSLTPAEEKDKVTPIEFTVN